MKSWRTWTECVKHWGSLVGLAVLAAPLVWNLHLLSRLSVIRGGEWMKDNAAVSREIIESSLLGYSWGVLTGLVGLVMVAFFTDALGYRPRWLGRSLLVLGVLWLACIPAGPVLGALILLWTLANRRRYQAYAQSQPGQAAAADETKPQTV